MGIEAGGGFEDIPPFDENQPEIAGMSEARAAEQELGYLGEAGDGERADLSDHEIFPVGEPEAYTREFSISPEQMRELFEGFTGQDMPVLRGKPELDDGEDLAYDADAKEDDW